MKMTKKQNETMFKYLADTKLNHDELQGVKDSIYLLFDTEVDDKAREMVLLTDILQEQLAKKENNNF